MFNCNNNDDNFICNLRRNFNNCNRCCKNDKIVKLINCGVSIPGPTGPTGPCCKDYKLSSFLI